MIHRQTAWTQKQSAGESAVKDTGGTWCTGMRERVMLSPVQVGCAQGGAARSPAGILEAQSGSQEDLLQASL